MKATRPSTSVRQWVSVIRRRWKRILGAGSLCTAGLLVGMLAAALRSPGWYDPPIIPPEDRQKVRNNLVAAEQAFTEGLRSSSTPFVYQLLQDDVNRWIAMRREIYPLIDELTPPQLADPFVVFQDGLFTVSGRYRTHLVDVVLSADFVPAMEDGCLVLRAKAVHCGSVRVPLSFGGMKFGEPIERGRGETWPGSPAMSGDFIRGLRLESEAWWKNGGSAYRVQRVSVEAGRLQIEIEPLGRRQPPDRKHQD